MAVASRPFPLTAREKFVPAIENRPLWARNLLFTRVLQVICKTARQRNFLRLAEESQRNSSRTPAYTIPRARACRAARRRAPPLPEPYARSGGLHDHPRQPVSPWSKPQALPGPRMPGVCDADIAIIRSHRHAQHVSRTKRYDRKLPSRTSPRANFCPGSILLSPGCRRRVSAPPPRWRGSWAPRGDHPVGAKCSDRPSTPGAAGTSADRGFRAGRRDGGVAARYRGGSAGPSAQIFARDI